MKVIREYRAYVSKGYRLCAFLIFPLIIVLAGCFFGWVFSGNDMCTLFGIIFLSGLQTGIDAFGLGPVCKKEQAVSSLIKTSPDGIKFMKRVVIQDLLLRVALYIGAGVIVCLFGLLFGMQVSVLSVLYVIVGFTITTAVMNLFRHIDNTQLTLFLTSISALVNAIIMVVLGFGFAFLGTIWQVAILALLVILAIVTIYLTYRHHVKCIHACYKR